MSTATKTARILLGATGVGVMAYGIVGFTTAPDVTARTEVEQWLIAGVIAHDALLAPTVFLLGAAAYRITGARLRGRLAALLLIGGSLVLISLPALDQKGQNPNHTVLPLDYARNLGVLLAGLVGAFVLLSVADTLRIRRRQRRLRAAEVVEVVEPEPETETEAEAAIEPEPESEPEAEPEPIPLLPTVTEPDADHGDDSDTAAE